MDYIKATGTAERADKSLANGEKIEKERWNSIETNMRKLIETIRNFTNSM